jgi:hypothetical protein
MVTGEYSVPWRRCYWRWLYGRMHYASGCTSRSSQTYLTRIGHLVSLRSDGGFEAPRVKTVQCEVPIGTINSNLTVRWLAAKVGVQCYVEPQWGRSPAFVANDWIPGSLCIGKPFILSDRWNLPLYLHRPHLCYPSDLFYAPVRQVSWATEHTEGHEITRGNVLHHPLYCSSGKKPEKFGSVYITNDWKALQLRNASHYRQ